MKVFLKKTVIFGFIILLFCVGLELLLLTKPNIYSYKRKYVESHLDDISVLLMGQSQIEEGLVPGIMCDSIFNFATRGRSLQSDVELAQYYIPKMNNLTIVVMPFAYHSFGCGRFNHRNDEWTGERLKRAVNTQKCMETKYLKVKAHGFYYWSEILFSGENYVSRLKQNKNSRSFCDSLGYVALDTIGRPEKWKEMFPNGEFDMSKKKDDKALEILVYYYETIAKLCKKQGAKLVLVSTPVYKTYQETMNKVVFQEMRDVADGLNNRYHNVEYYNFLFIKEFEGDDFKDVIHLTESGANKFSKMLADSLFFKGEERGPQP